MKHVTATPFWMTITIQVTDRPELNEIYEGDILDMSQQEQDQLKQLIGDGQAKVTASRELSLKDFGTGGSVFVSVTLTCDQSQAGTDAGLGWAAYIAETHSVKHLESFKQKLGALGLVQ